VNPHPADPAQARPLARQEAFDALASAVAGLLSAGKSPVSAAVKPALAASTNYRFDESMLGFASFRSFLRAAQEAGAVVVVPAPTGTDVSVLPPGEADYAATPRPRSVPVRADVWQAFVDWSPGWIRLWDRAHALALRFPEQRSESEDPAHSAARRLWTAEPERFVAIPPVTPDTTLAWMAEFSDSLPVEDARDALFHALRGPKPIRAWTDAARRHGVYHRWHDRRLRHLRGVVLAWAARNDVDLADVPVGGPSGPAPFSATPPDAVASSLTARDGDPVRQWLLTLVDRLPAAELRSINVPAHHAAQS
jgi:hypothetical protein